MFLGRAPPNLSIAGEALVSFLSLLVGLVHGSISGIPVGAGVTPV